MCTPVLPPNQTNIVLIFFYDLCIEAIWGKLRAEKFEDGRNTAPTNNITRKLLYFSFFRWKQSCIIHQTASVCCGKTEADNLTSDNGQRYLPVIKVRIMGLKCILICIFIFTCKANCLLNQNVNNNTEVRVHVCVLFSFCYLPVWVLVNLLID